MTDKLKNYTTRALLTKLRSLRLPEYWDDADPEFTREELKAELALRPHVPNKQEAKKIRQERAKKGRNK